MEPYLPADATLRAVVVGADLVAVLTTLVLLIRAGSAREHLVACTAGPAVAGLVGCGALLTVLDRSTGFEYLRVVEHALFHTGLAVALLGVAFAWPRRQRLVAAAAAGTAVLISFVYWWSHFVEITDLEVTRHEILTDRLEPGSDPLRVVVLADLQTDDFGDYERSVFAEIAALEPDLLLMPGDFVQLKGQEFFGEHRKFLQALRALPRPKLGILAVEGDIDPMRWRFRDPSAFFDDGGGPIARLVDDEFVVFEERRLQVLGLQLRSSRQPLSEEWLERVRAFDGLSLIVGHAPEFALGTIRGRAPVEAVMIAGHTHGGQVVLPGFGPPITLSSVPRDVAAGGLHRFGDALITVSRGVGHERGFAPRLRLFCRPELVVLDFVPAPKD